MLLLLRFLCLNVDMKHRYDYNCISNGPSQQLDLIAELDI